MKKLTAVLVGLSLSAVSLAADTPLSGLPSATTLGGTELIYGVQGGTSKSLTPAQLKAYTIGAGSISTASGKTATFSNTLTFTGTDTSSIAFGAGGTVMYNPMTTGGDVIYGGSSGLPTRLANGTAGQCLTSAGTTLAPTWGACGSGGGTPGGSTTQVQYNNAGAFAGITGATTNGTALTLVAPVLGTPASATLTNATGLPISTGVSGLGTGNATALAVNVGTAGSFNPMTTGGDVIYGGASGAPTRLANGTNGQVLTSGGTTAAPTWTSLSSGNTLSSTQVGYGNGSNVMTGSADLTFDSTNRAFAITNPGTGSAGVAVLNLGNSSGANVMQFSKLSTGYTPSGLATANASVMFNSAGDLVVAQGGASPIVFSVAGLGSANEAMRILGAAGSGSIAGNIGIGGAGGVTNPTARLHIKAGSATAGTAPLKLNSGTVLTTPEAGAIEFDGTDLFWTVGSTRKKFDSVPTICTPAVSSNTITFDGSSGCGEFQTSLTANVTSSSTTGFVTGRRYSFLLTQDGTGGRTVVLPTNFTGGCAVNTTATVYTLQSGYFDGTNVVITSCSDGETPTRIAGPTRSAAGTPANGNLNCWFDSTDNTFECKDSSANITRMVKVGTGVATSLAVNNGSAGSMNPMTAGGQIIYGGASGISTALSNGTVGQVLTSGGTTVAPSWTTVSGSGTVTATGGSLTSNALVLGAGSTDTKVAAGIVTDGTSKITLGVSGTNVGAVALNNATSGTITLSPATGALGTTAVTVPATAGTLVVNPMTTGGDVLYGGASGVPTRLANGTAGQVLRSAGSTSAPTWLSLGTVLAMFSANNASIAGSTTVYVFHNGTNTSENIRQVPMPFAGTIKTFYLNLITTQPGDGGITCSFNKNGSASGGPSITIPASSTTQVFSDTSGSFTVAAGDLVSMKCVNSSASTSGFIGGSTIMLYPN